MSNPNSSQIPTDFDPEQPHPGLSDEQWEDAYLAYRETALHELTLEGEELANNVPIQFLAGRAWRRYAGLPLPPFRPALVEYQAAEAEHLRREPWHRVIIGDESDSEGSDSEAYDTPPQSPLHRAARKPIEGECEVCYCSLKGGDETEGTGNDTADEEKYLWCQRQCGKNYHAECINSWLTESRESRRKPTCPNCRARWVE